MTSDLECESLLSLSAPQACLGRLLPEASFGNSKLRQAAAVQRFGVRELALAFSATSLLGASVWLIRGKPRTSKAVASHRSPKVAVSWIGGLT